MEEKLKEADGQFGDSEMRLLQQCQDLQASVQEKEEVIVWLEQQLEEQVHKQVSQIFLCLYLKGKLPDIGKPFFCFVFFTSRFVFVSPETVSTPGGQDGGRESSQDQGLGDAEVVRGKPEKKYSNSSTSCFRGNRLVYFSLRWRTQH